MTGKVCHSEERSDEESRVGGMKEYYVYIMTNRSGTLYTGVTSDLQRRIFEHKNHLVEGFTKKYRISRLVHFESSGDVRSAIAREKQIKGWLRKKKIALIEKTNPEWKDLAADWYADSSGPQPSE